MHGMTASGPPHAQTWLTTDEVAAHARRATVTVRRAAASGELHSHQPKPRGRRRFHVDAVDAWMLGASDKAQASACGCVHLQTVKRSDAV